MGTLEIPFHVWWHTINVGQWTRRLGSPVSVPLIKTEHFRDPEGQLKTMNAPSVKGPFF